MEKETYKVDLTEKEAKVIGERRWRGKYERSWTWGALITCGIAMGLLFSAAIGLPPWAGIAGFWVFGFTSVLCLLLPMVFATKAGKAFARSQGGKVADLAEEEARVIGKMRWREKNKDRERRYLFGVTGLVIFAVGVAILTSVLGTLDWVSLGLFCIFMAPALFLCFRWARLKERAGKVFVQSLEAEEWRRNG